MRNIIYKIKYCILVYKQFYPQFKTVLFLCVLGTYEKESYQYDVRNQIKNINFKPKIPRSLF